MDPNQQNNQQQTDPAQQTQPAGPDVGNIITAQQPQQPVTISIGDGVGTMTGDAMGSTAAQQQPTPAQQPVQVQPLDSIIQQLQAQNAALMQQNEALNAQVVKLINGGAQVNTQPQQQQPTQVQQMPAQVQQMLSMGAQPDPLGVINPPSLADGHDWSMEGLAGEIGGDRAR